MNRDAADKTRQNRSGISGMTLLELVVYIALAALLMAPVVMLMHNASLNMARDSNSMNLRVSGRDAVNIMYDDIRGTGFKLRQLNPAVVVDPAIQWGNRVPVNPADLSSFNHINSAAAAPVNPVPSDQLTILKGVLNPNTPNQLSWIGFDEITYRVENNNLLRRHIRTDNTVNPAVIVTDETHIIARNVETLQFQFAADPNPASWVNALTTAGQKSDTRYIKAILVLRTNKRVAAANLNNDGVTVADLTLGPTGGTAREIYEIVIPTPNNGVFPPI